MEIVRKPHWAQRGQMSALTDLRSNVTRNLDILVVLASLVVAHFFRFGDLVFSASELLLSLVYIVIYSITASFLGLYSRGNLISANGVWIAGYTYLISLGFLSLGLTATHLAESFSRIWFFSGTAISVVSIVLIRVFLISAVQKGWVKFPVSKSVIIGSGPLARELADRLSGDPYKSNEVIGFFTEGDTSTDFNVDRTRCLGLLGDVESKLEELRSCGRPVDRIFVALPAAEIQSKLEFVEGLVGSQYSILIVPDFSIDLLTNSRPDDVSGLPVIDVSHSQLHGMRATAKHIIDLVLASLGILFLSPLLLLIAAAIKLDSKGPVFFSQRRYGIGGREICVNKFRSMSVMENGLDVRQATQNDSRVTRVGRFLRSSSLDELPQLFNVLDGTMSLVGPRPHAVSHNEQYRRLIGGYMARHAVKPGITGLAQVSGCRGEIFSIGDMERRVKYDREYLRKWSIGLDFSIILRTIAQLIRGGNVY